MDAGVVRLIVPKSIEISIAPYLLEQTMYPISNDEEIITDFIQICIPLAHNYFISTTVTPNPPSLGIPFLYDATLLCRFK